MDLKKSPGMQAIHSNKPKKYYLQNITKHELAHVDEPASDVEDNSPEPSEASDDDVQTIDEASDEESTESESDDEDEPLRARAERLERCMNR